MASRTLALRRIGTGHPGDAEFAHCKGVLRHAWDVVIDTSSDADIDLLCVRCTMERHDWLNVDGSLHSRVYVPPDGYRVKGEARLAMADARLLLLQELSKNAGKPAPRRRPNPNGKRRTR